MASRPTDAALGAWRVRVQYPGDTPPLTYWGDTIAAALASWQSELPVAARRRVRESRETLEDAVLGAGRPVTVTVSSTEWPA